MAKFCGNLGFNVSVDKGHGVWENEIVVRKYYGDLINLYKRYSESNAGINDNVILHNKVSILADSFAMTNIPSIVYVELNGVKWKVSSVDVEYPRLTITAGGVYNGE